MKARTMIYLEPEQLRALKAEARKQGISLAEILRRLVDRHLKERGDGTPAPAETYRKLVALGSSGRSDVSERHDAYLGQALRRERAR